MADQSQPNASHIAAVGVVAAVILFVLMVVSLYLLPAIIHQEQHEKVELAPTTMLDSLHAEETEHLTQPAFVDQKNGIVRIPISLAMDLEARHSWRADLPVPATTFPNAPAVAAAATTATATNAAKPVAPSATATPAAGAAK